MSDRLDEIEARWAPLFDVYKENRLFYFDQYGPVDVPYLIASVRKLRASVTELCNLLHGTDD